MIDIGYGIRFSILALRHRAAKPKANLRLESVIFGRCWPNDLDTNSHMNNARYLRNADFSRMSLLLLEWIVGRGQSEKRQISASDSSHRSSSNSISTESSISRSGLFSLDENGRHSTMLVEDLGYGTIESPILSPAVEAFKQNHQLTFEAGVSRAGRGGRGCCAGRGWGYLSCHWSFWEQETWLDAYAEAN